VEVHRLRLPRPYSTVHRSRAWAKSNSPCQIADRLHPHQCLRHSQLRRGSMIRIAKPRFLSTKEFHRCPRSLLTRILLSTKERHLCPRSMPMRILLSTKERHFLCPRPLPKYASHRMMGAETSWPTCGPRCHSSHKDTTVYPWSDFSLRVSPDDQKVPNSSVIFFTFPSTSRIDDSRNLYSVARGTNPELLTTS